MLGRKGRELGCWRLTTWIKAIGYLQIIFFSLLAWQIAKVASVITDNILEQKRMSKLIEDLKYGTPAGGGSTLMEHAVHFSRSALVEFQIPGWDRLNFFEQQSMWPVGTVLALIELYSIVGIIMGVLLLTGILKKKARYLGAWLLFGVFSLVLFLLILIVVIYLIATLVGVTRVLLIVTLIIAVIIPSLFIVHQYKHDLDLEVTANGRRDVHEFEDEEEFRLQKSYKDPDRYI